MPRSDADVCLCRAGRDRVPGLVSKQFVLYDEIVSHVSTISGPRGPHLSTLAGS